MMHSGGGGSAGTLAGILTVLCYPMQHQGRVSFMLTPQQNFLLMNVTIKKSPSSPYILKEEILSD